MSKYKPYTTPSERFPLTHTMLDETLGRYVLKSGSVEKFTDILHDCGTGSEAQFVIRWGRLDRENFQTRRENSANLWHVSSKLLNKGYKLEDKSICSWRDEEKKLLNKALSVSLEDKGKKIQFETHNDKPHNDKHGDKRVKSAKRKM